MTPETPQKVAARHLRRRAYLYVRQSSLRQVFENTESTKRQYALRQRALALGWPQDQIVVIDSDQGRSGASATEREGFQQLVAEVGLGRAGLVMGLEVSRLARNSTDWHRLLEICALTDTLILDEDGLYDPSQFNDRLLLGLKGTMSEAELHVLRARLRGGIVSKARRGELWSPLPIGLVYHPDGHVVLDPDTQVQESLRHFFRTFRRTGSAMATVKAFRAEGLRFPRRVRAGVHKGELAWAELTHPRALEVLHNPRYAGAFFFGRSRQRKLPDGRTRFEPLPRDEWIALLPDAHPGYLSWEEFEENLRRLRENSAAHGDDRRRSPPREGPALLQGLTLCGRCGARMTVRYHGRQGIGCPEYVCQRDGIQRGTPLCQRIPGASIDASVGQLLLELVTPLTLEVALSVELEIQTRLDQADALRRQHVERACYEAEVARRRYLQVDPDHRLVADELEREWNQKLRALTEAQEHYEKEKNAQRPQCDEEQRRKIRALATDFPRLWNDPATSHRDRKRVVRLLIEDVTLVRGRQELVAHLRLRGGTTQTLRLPLPRSAWELRQTSPEVVAQIDRLLDHHPHGEIAQMLNAQGLRSGEGKTFHRLIVWRIERAYGLKPRYARLREAGMLTLPEVAERLGVCTSTAKVWRRAGLLRSHVYNDKGQHLYELPGDEAPVKHRWKGLSSHRRVQGIVSHAADEVQYER
jgi:DNA invertase Pin-like site-specific DNA recombinase